MTTRPKMHRQRLLYRFALLLLLVALVCTALAKKPQSSRPAPAPIPSASYSSSPPPKSERDNDPVIQKVRGLRNAAMRENDQRQFTTAIEKLRKSLTLMNDRVFGEGRKKIAEKDQSLDAAFYAQLLGDYGAVLIRADQHDEAIEVLSDAVEMTKRVFGESHPSLGLSLRSLADALLAKKNYKQALAKYKLLRSHIRKGLGVTHEGFIEVQLKIAEIYKTQGNSAKAIKLLKSVLEDQGDEVNGATAGIGEVYMELATLQLKAKDLTGAESAARAARMIMHTRDGENSVTHAFSLNALAGVRMAQGKVDESYALLQDAHAIAVSIYGRDHAMVRASAQTLEQVKLRLASQRTDDFKVDEHIEL